MSNLSGLASVSDHLHSVGGQSTVLVVEDDLMVRQAVTMMLEDEGFNIVTAIDGVDGLQKFHKIKLRAWISRP